MTWYMWLLISPSSIRMSSGFPFLTPASFVSGLLVEWVGFRSSQTKLYPHLGAAAYFLNLNVRKISYVIFWIFVTESFHGKWEKLVR